MKGAKERDGRGWRQQWQCGASKEELIAQRYVFLIHCAPEVSDFSSRTMRHLWNIREAILEALSAKTGWEWDVKTSCVWLSCGRIQARSDCWEPAQDNCFTLAPRKNVQILEMECVSGTEPRVWGVWSWGRKSTFNRMKDYSVGWSYYLAFSNTSVEFSTLSFPHTSQRFAVKLI